MQISIIDFLNRSDKFLLRNKLSVLQKKAIRIIAGVRPITSTHPLFQELKLLNLINWM